MQMKGIWLASVEYSEEFSLESLKLALREDRDIRNHYAIWGAAENCVKECHISELSACGILLSVVSKIDSLISEFVG